MCLITSVPIEGNFYTRTIGQEWIIATYHQAEELIAASGRNHVEYAALAICQELLSFEFQRVTGEGWDKLFHQDPRGCIFDFAGIKSQKVAKLRQCIICESCSDILKDKNLSHKSIGFTNKLLSRIRKESLSKAFYYSISSPGLSFVYGGLVVGTAVNLFSSSIMSSAPISNEQKIFLSVFASLIVIFPLGVYIFMAMKDLRARFK